ncbi:hypothetical protein HFP57_08645 [Parasphingopyxis algicola]|uniref:metallophosphoesterase family protein n=1 Tax=Parasphingopyxis algicola TaxID=2026624 RepID=UPI0015A49130|nr:hypothetical protein [Parasphingopyxis algicola]QLC25087.1 hypothetical protein HFP57_08645 [Parasphingopyxis algicola]
MATQPDPEKERAQLEQFKAKLDLEGDNPLDDFFHYLVESEDQALALIYYVDHPHEPPPKVPSEGNIEFGFILYWIHYPPAKVQGWLNDHPFLDGVFKTLQDLAPPTHITTAQYDALVAKIETTAVSWDDGTLIGTGKYEQLDEGWILAAINYAANIVIGGIVSPFPCAPISAVPMTRKDGDGAKDPVIGIIGDWGTGYYSEPDGGNCPAKRVLEDVTGQPIDYLMHLGDVYYAGTDWRPLPGEEYLNFKTLWPDQGTGRNFTLNSNHEMYGAASGYFDVALEKGGPFAHQNGLSFFALEYHDWLLLGLDSGYFSDQENGRKFYMDGAIGTATHREQIDQIRSVCSGHQGPVMVMTHHNPCNSFTANTNILFKQVGQAIGAVGPAVWYWGHVHNGIVYEQLKIGDSIPYVPTKGRCCGHGAIPFGNGWGFERNSNIAYYAHTHDDEFPADSPRVKNGYALVTLHRDGGFSESLYEVGNSTPVFQKSWTAGDLGF